MCGSRPHGHRTWSSTDRKSTRLNSSHVEISYAVFCLKNKISERQRHHPCLSHGPFVQKSDRRQDRGYRLRAELARAQFRFFFNDTATPQIYTLSLHDALPI